MSNSIKSEKNNLIEIDITLFSTFLSLLSIGLIAVASTSMDISNLKYAKPLAIFINHSVFACLGLIAMATTSLITIEKIKNWSWFAITIAILLLISVLIIGKEVNGSLRWLSLGVFRFQPSELAKLLIIIYTAAYLTRHLTNLRSSWVWFIKPFIVLMLVSSLLLIEPDFGSVATLTIATMGMIFIAEARLNHFFILLTIAFLGIAILVIIEPYRLVRITSYMDPWAHAFGSGYQLTQSLIAIGRGGWFGLGLGNSIQKLFYLPEAHNDFIFSVIAEELGLIGCILLILLYAILCYRGLKIAQQAGKNGIIFHSYLAYGIVLLFIIQVIFNIGVNVGLLPTKGLVLPLISYGGSNIVVSCIEIGILLRIDYEIKRLQQINYQFNSRKHN